MNESFRIQLYTFLTKKVIDVVLLFKERPHTTHDTSGHIQNTDLEKHKLAAKIKEYIEERNRRRVPI